jgi:hypothetical protein
MFDLLGIPWTSVSCVGVINALDRLPNVDGTKWGRIAALQAVPWHQRRTGDLVLWREYKGVFVPHHVGLIIGADENFILHSGYTGDPRPDWKRFSTVHVFQMMNVYDRGLVLRGRPL